MKRAGNVLLCGVGGQGVLLASEIISSALMNTGLDVKQSEVHGMAQRGGSIVSHIRYGEKVYSPLIEPGTTDIIVSFELSESLRYLSYMNNRSKVIVNTQKILPPSVAVGLEKYPEDAVGQLRRLGLSVMPVAAVEIAKSSGEMKAMNLVLVGALSIFLPVEEKTFLSVAEERIPEKLRRSNIEAFLKGRETIKKLQEVSQS